MSLAVGLVSYRRSHITQRCIDSLREHSRFVDHVYIADNGSEDSDTRAHLRKWEREAGLTVLRSDRNLGPSAGRNRILDVGLPRHDVFALLDNDVVALPGWDEAALGAIAQGADLVQPKLLCADRQHIDRGPTSPNPDRLAVNPIYLGRGADRYAPEVSYARDTEVVGSGIIAAAVFRQAGCFDPDFFVAEDFDLSLRARAAGFSLRYEPRCEMIHDHGSDRTYDLARQDVGRILVTHDAMWRKHGRYLLDPRWHHWYRWLAAHHEPMVMPRRYHPTALWRRFRRRLVFSACMRGHPATWR